MAAHARRARRGKCDTTLDAWWRHAASATRRDPRAAPARFADLRLDALRRGFPSRRRAVTLVGGADAREWHARLTAAEFACGWSSRATRADDDGGDPTARRFVFGAALPARWREAMIRGGMTELRDFVFIA